MPVKTRKPPKEGLARPDFIAKPESFEEGVDNILRILEENRKMLLECNAMLDALIKHLEVPYKPQAGFLRE